LTDENVNKLRSDPGAYILGYASGGTTYSAYVGRSDDDLKGRLRAHLPRNETNSCITRKGCHQFWHQYAQSALEAYEVECRTYHDKGVRVQ